METGWVRGGFLYALTRPNYPELPRLIKGFFLTPKSTPLVPYWPHPAMPHQGPNRGPIKKMCWIEANRDPITKNK